MGHILMYPNALEKLLIAIIISIHKRVSKLEYSNYRPIPLLSNIDKILEKWTALRQWTGGSGLVVKALDFQDWSPKFKTTGWLQN